MQNNKITALIMVNSMVFVVFALMWVYSVTLLPVTAALRVTELDRAGVFDQDKLEQHFPLLATDVRGQVPRWIAQSSHDTARKLAIGGMIFSFFNIFFLWLIRSDVKKMVARAGDDILPTGP